MHRTIAARSRCQAACAFRVVVEIMCSGPRIITESCCAGLRVRSQIWFACPNCRQTPSCYGTIRAEHRRFPDENWSRMGTAPDWLYFAFFRSLFERGRPARFKIDRMMLFCESVDLTAHLWHSRAPSSPSLAVHRQFFLAVLETI